MITDHSLQTLAFLRELSDGERIFGLKSDLPSGYIYRRYQRRWSTEMEESFFHILWSQDQFRTSWLEE